MARGGKKGRVVNGIILLDKPIGITSNAALQAVKRLFGARKAGHTGSLDPLASGLLPICFGEATKVSAFLLNADKGYRATVKFGIRTNTGDADGEVLATRPVGELDRQYIEQVLQKFRGTIQQVPPMHSAIKQQGVPLYVLAHRGEEVEREARTITVRKLEVLHLGGDEMEIDVLCTKGTYIRTLAEDIGEVIGCGAHICALRRTAVGPFDPTRMVTMEQLSDLAGQGFDELDEILLPMETALSNWPEVELSDDAVYYLRQGQAVFVPRVAIHGWVRLKTGDKRFLGVGQILADGRVAPRKLVKAI